MTAPTADEIDAALADRHAVLRAIVDTPRPKSTLEDHLDCSRSTVDRAIRELREAGLVEYDGGAWTPTELGWCAHQARERYRHRLDDLTDAAPLLGLLPAESPLGCVMVEGATAIEADPATPDAVLERLLDLLEGVDSLRLATPTLGIGFAEGLYERLVDGGTALELHVTDDVRERLDQTVPSLRRTLTTDDRVALRVAAVPFSFGLWLADDRVGVVVFAEYGIGGVLVNDDSDARAWGERHYERVRRKGTEPSRPVR